MSPEFLFSTSINCVEGFILKISWSSCSRLAEREHCLTVSRIIVPLLLLQSGQFATRKISAHHGVWINTSRWTKGSCSVFKNFKWYRMRVLLLQLVEKFSFVKDERKCLSMLHNRWIYALVVSTLNMKLTDWLYIYIYTYTKSSGNLSTDNRHTLSNAHTHRRAMAYICIPCAGDENGQ